MHPGVWPELLSTTSLSTGTGKQVVRCMSYALSKAISIDLPRGELYTPQGEWLWTVSVFQNIQKMISKLQLRFYEPGLIAENAIYGWNKGNLDTRFYLTPEI